MAGKKAYEGTRVSVAQSKEQIERLLKRYSVVATRFTSFPAYAELAFVRQVGEKGKEHLIPYRITVTPKLKKSARSPANELDRAERQVWRVVYWWVKAKIEAVEFGLHEFEREFLPFALVSDSQGRPATVGDVLVPRWQKALPADESDPFSGLRPLPPPKEEHNE